MIISRFQISTVLWEIELCRVWFGGLLVGNSDYFQMLGGLSHYVVGERVVREIIVVGEIEVVV